MRLYKTAVQFVRNAARMLAFADIIIEIVPMVRRMGCVSLCEYLIDLV